MAKGSVRKKGKKWYYRFYVEDASGNLVQKEFTGTESKSETEKLLRQAMEDYEEKKFIAKADNITLGKLLDIWAEEELKVGTLSNGTVENYLGAIRCIKKHPVADRRLKTITAEHLQTFLDLLTFGGTYPDGKVKKGLSKDYIHSFSAVLQQSFRFAVFPKQLITLNPMQYIKLKRKAEEVDLFSEEDMGQSSTQPISHDDYEKLIAYLKKKNVSAVLPIQIAYYAGLRIGEVCGLTWQDIPADYNEISFVCLRPDGCLETPSTLSIVCRTLAKKLDGFEGFHFHQLRHTYTSNLLSNGAAPKDVQELLGHSDVSTTMNVYAHATREAKRTSARLLDKVTGND